MDFLKDNKRVNKIISLIYILLFILVIFLFFQTLSSVKSYRLVGTEIPPQAVINVSGEGEVFAVPDMATFNFSIVESADTSDEASNLVNDKMKEVKDSLLELGIEEKDIKTSGYNLYPRYEFPRQTGRRVLVGYEVSHNVSVKVRDIDEAGKVLEAVGRLGVSNVSGLTFSIEDEDDLIREARQIAIEDAKSKAEALSNDLGVKLVRIIGFNESRDYFDMPYLRSEMMESAPMGMGGDSANVEIMTGENRIYSNIHISYEIR